MEATEDWDEEDELDRLLVEEVEDAESAYGECEKSKKGSIEVYVV